MFNNCGINKVFLVGTISKEPRWHKSGEQADMLHFNLTTKENIGKFGLPVEHLEVHRLKIPAKNVSQSLIKGQVIHVEGKIQTQSFVDEQQICRYNTEIIVNRVIVISDVEVTAV